MSDIDSIRRKLVYAEDYIHQAMDALDSLEQPDSDCDCDEDNLPSETELEAERIVQLHRCGMSWQEDALEFLYEIANKVV